MKIVSKWMDDKSKMKKDIGVAIVLKLLITIHLYMQ